MSSVVKILQLRRLEMTNCREFRQQIDELMSSSPNYILIDCQDFNFIDDSGLGALVVASKTIRNSGGQLVFCSFNKQIKAIFELTNMDKVWEIFPDRETFYAKTGATE